MALARPAQNTTMTALEGLDAIRALAVEDVALLLGAAVDQEAVPETLTRLQRLLGTNSFRETRSAVLSALFFLQAYRLLSSAVMALDHGDTENLVAVGPLTADGESFVARMRRAPDARTRLVFSYFATKVEIGNLVASMPQRGVGRLSELYRSLPRQVHETIFWQSLVLLKTDLARVALSPDQLDKYTWLIPPLLAGARNAHEHAAVTLAYEEVLLAALPMQPALLRPGDELRGVALAMRTLRMPRLHRRLLAAAYAEDRKLELAMPDDPSDVHAHLLAALPIADLAAYATPAPPEVMRHLLAGGTFTSAGAAPDLSRIADLVELLAARRLAPALDEVLAAASYEQGAAMRTRSGRTLVGALAGAGMLVGSHWRRWAPQSDEPDALGRTPLHVAAIENRAASVAPLVATMASPEALDAAGDTPLHTAVLWESHDFMAAMIDAGADHSALNSAGYTPLDIAVRRADTAAAGILAPLCTHRPSVMRLLALICYAGDPSAVGDLVKDMWETPVVEGLLPLEIAALGDNTRMITFMTRLLLLPPAEQMDSVRVGDGRAATALDYAVAAASWDFARALVAEYGSQLPAPAHAFAATEAGLADAVGGLALAPDGTFADFLQMVRRDAERLDAQRRALAIEDSTRSLAAWASFSAELALSRPRADDDIPSLFSLSRPGSAGAVEAWGDADLLRFADLGELDAEVLAPLGDRPSEIEYLLDFSTEPGAETSNASVLADAQPDPIEQFLVPVRGRPAVRPQVLENVARLAARRASKSQAEARIREILQARQVEPALPPATPPSNGLIDPEESDAMELGAALVSARA